MIRSYLAQNFDLLATDRVTVIRTIAPSGSVATVNPGTTTSAADIDGIPATCFACPASITGLPAPDDGTAILVSAIVADGMRQLGLHHPAGVYTPQPLVFDAQRKPLGSTGLIYHADLS